MPKLTVQDETGWLSRCPHQKIRVAGLGGKVKVDNFGPAGGYFKRFGFIEVAAGD